MSDTPDIHTNVAQEYPAYLRDESRRTGEADSIAFPRTEAELCDQLRWAAARDVPVTVQGARTGIAAGAVPAGGHILNLSRMNAILRLPEDGLVPATMTVQPGVLLSEARKAIAALSPNTLCFPPDPTETSASIGGMVSCNASGAQSFRYGPTRRYVERARVVLADGDVLVLQRGEPVAAGRAFELRTEGGRALCGELPSYTMPAVKNAAGYFAQDNMDLLDLFIGSDGTLGVFSEIVLRLVPAPAATWGLMAFLPSEDSALEFVRHARQPLTASPLPPSNDGCAAVVAAIEFFDACALELLRTQKRDNPAFGDLPALPPEWHTAVYVELHGPDEDAVEEIALQLAEQMVECGGDEDATWLASDDRELGRLKDFRHAVPESVNLLIDERRKQEPSLTKLGTDLAVPDEALTRVMALYRESLAAQKFEYVMFGHIGSNHVHVNILPRTRDEYAAGKALYENWARAVVAMGGSVSAEHGIGKLKTALLEAMYGADGIAEMRRIKRLFDPSGCLNRGNLFA